MIAQQAALDFSDRVASLTSIMSSPSNPDDPDLPGMSGDVLAAVVAMQSDTGDPVEASLRLFKALSGSRYTFDDDAFRVLFRAGLDRGGFNPKCAHGLAVGASPSRRQRLGELSVPTLVLHGDEDPILPVEHGQATADAIPGARLVVAQGVGHELPAGAVRDYLVAIRELLAASG